MQSTLSLSVRGLGGFCRTSKAIRLFGGDTPRRRSIPAYPEAKRQRFLAPLGMTPWTCV